MSSRMTIQPEGNDGRPSDTDCRSGFARAAEHPPKVCLRRRAETEAGAYARRANRVVVKHKKGFSSYVEPLAVGDPLP